MIPAPGHHRAGEWERSRRISRGTCAALADLRERGVRLGRPRRCPDDVLALVVASRGAGARLADICARLNADGVPTPGGSTRWYPSHVSRLLRTQDGVAARTGAAAPG
jgi:hypothetical protein